MSSPKMQPPWEFLLSASRNSLQSFELSRLSHAANLRKEISALLDEWMEENSAAMLARWLIEHREWKARTIEELPARSATAESGHSVSDNFFANGTASLRASRGSG